MTSNFQEARLSQIPALHFAQRLDARIYTAVETFFFQAGQAGNLEQHNGYGLRNEGWVSLRVSQILRILACKARPMCDLSLNRPATPLHDAHQGGCFMYTSLNEGGGL